MVSKLHPKLRLRPWMVGAAVGFVALFAASLWLAPRVVPRHAPPGFVLYEAEGYSAVILEGWRIAERDRLETTYRRTKLVSPGGQYRLIVDRTPGEETDPSDKALQGDSLEVTAKRPGYRRLTLRSSRIDGRPAFEWTFEQGGNRYAHYFLRVGGDGYAVAGTGYDFDTVKERTRRLAASIEPR